MHSKMLMVAVLAVVLSAQAAAACYPNPSLMQDACYSSCANQAQYYYETCHSACSSSNCSWSGGQMYCTPQWLTCTGGCDGMRCANLNECQDYCHDW